MKTIILMLFPVLLSGQINYQDFTLFYNEDLNIAEFASYRLTREMVEGAGQHKRVSFRKENGVSPRKYIRSGYDRGHLFPAGNASYDSIRIRETFDMANIIPQLPDLNRGIWKITEEFERSLALHYGCIWVRIEVQPGDKNFKQVNIPESYRKIIEDCKGNQILNLPIINH